MSARIGSSWARSILENLEALAIAVVMALVLKYFLIEAYKIPTGSMQPTIMGDSTTGVFDRVLVNKLVYFFREPRRFEVIVFKNPLYQRQNYIKRLVAFGGERLTIRNGDLWVSRNPQEEASVQRKPDSVWRSVRKRIWPLENGQSLRQFLEIEGDAQIQGDEIRFSGQESRHCQVRNTRPIVDGYYDGYHPLLVNGSGRSHATDHHGDGNAVGDIEISAVLTPGANAGIVVAIAESDRVHELRIDSRQETSIVATGLRDPNARIQNERIVFKGESPSLRPGKKTRFSFRNVDDELVLVVDGEEIVRHQYLSAGVDLRFETLFSIAVEGEARVENLRVYRDIHYLPTGERQNLQQATYVVPEGHLFALGDNTQNSSDSRAWETVTFRWKEMKDGKEIVREEVGNHYKGGALNPDTNPRAVRDTTLFRNIFGQLHTIPGDRVLGHFANQEIASYNSLPGEMLLGKALAVFWPLRPFSPVWRLKWVR